jgi:ATP-binding cassette subfamily F protein 3
MSIVTGQQISLSYGAFEVFGGMTFSIARDSKIGLIGPNGVGKTSLLLILANLLSSSAGSLNIARNCRMGYLRQEAVDAFADRTSTVYAEMLTVFSDLQDMQARLHELEVRMSAGDHSAETLEQYGGLQAAFEHQGGYDFDVRIQKSLEGLGLGKKHWHMPLNQLSGGQKTRALLARLLLEKPDLLLLDEPTNHLDIEAVEWLEYTLRDWQGAVLVVSHDRYFLDNTVNTIWEMRKDGLDVYSGNYNAYLLQRQQRWEYYERVFTEEKTRLLNEVDFIQRNWVRASTHARALGRLRLLSRDLSIVENYGIMALRSGKQWNEFGLSADRPLDVIEAVRKVNSISLPNNRPPAIRPSLSVTRTGGNIVFRLEDLHVGYSGNPLFTCANAELRRGQCAALIGPNGSGKTTFLKVLLGQLPALSGDVNLGAGLKIGYFAQSQDFLLASGSDENTSILDELMRRTGMLPEKARNFLAQYLFRGEDVFKPVSGMSGGERARLALGLLALEGANFLLLDEPTNHLDIPAQEALQEVLENFNGTILLVSHDRYLIDRLATQVWELREGALKIFQGTYREYSLRRSVPESKRAPGIILPAKPLLRGDSRESRKRLQNLALLEERIHQQETAIRRLSGELQRAGKDKAFERMRQISQQVAREQAALENLMQEWEQVAA